MVHSLTRPFPVHAGGLGERLPIYSGGPALDSHQLPYSTLLGSPKLFLCDCDFMMHHLPEDVKKKVGAPLPIFPNILVFPKMFHVESRV